MPYFPEEVVEHTFSYIISHRDRNAVSMVCKAWYRIERLSRRSVFIGNCYSVKPERVMDRFPYVKSLVLKGKPHFADLNLIPKGWGGFAKPWIEAAVQKWPGMEETRLKRMVVRDKDLELLARSFSNFKALVLDRCEGFSYSGLAAIAVHCRFLKKLDLQETVVIEHGPQWLNFFPDSSTSLVSLNFACLKGAVSPITLERLVARSPNLKSLRLNRAVSAEMLVKILARAPQLTDLGLSSVIFDTPLEAYHRVSSAVDKCKSLRSLSGFWNAPPRCLEAFYPVCGKLTALNLSYARAIQGATLIKIIHQCHKLRRLWVVDRIGDEGLEAVATTCKHLQELSVFPSKITRWGPASVTEEGLISVSSGCRKLNSLLYYCRRMTNLALITVAKNCPNFIRFRLCILTPGNPDPLTNQPLDEGFGAIVQSCKNLKRLSLSGLLTDQVFIYIGMYAEKLEMLSVALAGQSDKGMAYVLNGCRNLKKLEIRDSPFGDSAILENVNKFANMRFLWMSSCDLTLRGCKTLATKMPMLNVEVMSVRDDDGDDKIDEDNKDLRRVETLYVYRTTAGPREDVPNFVQTL